MARAAATVTIHIAGGGLSGLAAAWAARAAGHAEVMVHEAAPQLGGRCRALAFQDGFPVVDNGAHVILGANRVAFDWLAAFDARDRVIPAIPDALPVRDISSGKTFRVPVAASSWDLWRHPWVIALLTRAVFNARPRAVAVRPRLALAMRLMTGGHGALRPWIARESLTDAFIRPARKALAARGVGFRMNDRLKELTLEGGRVREAHFTGNAITFGPADRLILALPPNELRRLLPGAVAGTVVPSPIVNVHYAFDARRRIPGRGAMLGVLGGNVEWVFARGATVTAMRSAAVDSIEQDRDHIARLFWRDTASVLGLGAEGMPPARVVKERQATWPEARLRNHGLPANLRVAGDWCARPLPCCIEAAVLSGRRAGGYPWR